MCRVIRLKTWAAVFRCLLGFRTASIEQKSFLLDQPYDIFHEILKFLPPESAVALSLTCKATYSMLFSITQRNLQGSSVRRLLLLLEKDLSRHFFYCYSCNRLHRFSMSWTPSPRTESYYSELPCRPKIDIPNYRVGIGIGFHHARLAMNAYHFGDEHGLSLKRFERILYDFPDGWKMQSVAKIIQKHLFLSVLHTLVLRGSRDHNRRAIESYKEYWICYHTTTHPYSASPYERKGWVRRIPELSPWDEPLSYNYVKDCVGGVCGSCLVCLTDFETTVEQPQRQPADLATELLNVTIVSYHQLGPCRSPSDWKWQTFGTTKPSTPVTRRRYIDSFHKPGAVKRRWDAACGV